MFLPIEKCEQNVFIADFFSNISQKSDITEAM